MMRWIGIVGVAVAAFLVGAASPHLALAGTTLTVTTTTDPTTCPSSNPGSQSPLSLRCAMAQASADGSGDTIDFNIPSTDSGCTAQTIQGHNVSVCTIALKSGIGTGSTIINGYTQPGSLPNTSTTGDNAVLTIRIDGTGTQNDPLTLDGSGAILEGVSVTGFNNSTFNEHGVHMGLGVLEGDFIGLTPAGVAAPNYNGVEAAAGATIGYGAGNPCGPSGTSGAPCAANVISDNTQYGVDVEGSGVTVAGNYIGTTPGGTTAAGNYYGIFVLSSNTTIGGTSSPYRNVISGNRMGIRGGSFTGTVIQGNYVGVDPTGTSLVIPNLCCGPDVYLSSRGALVGGTTAGARNVIVPWTYNTALSMDSYGGDVVEGNYIGVNVNGAVVLTSNQGSGILADVAGETIGGTTPGAGNVIAGVQNAIAMTPAYSRAGSTVVEGNYIGTDAAGDQLGVVGPGVSIVGAGSIAAIGGTASGAGNTVAYASGPGVLIGNGGGDTPHVAIEHNSIHDNGGLGIDLAPEGYVNCGNYPLPPGPNDRINCPFIRGATTSGIQGLGQSGDTIEVYIATNESDDQGHGEGKTYLGSATVDGTGQWSLAAPFAAAVSNGQYITATQTGPVPSSPGNYETSEFAANVVVGGPTAARVGSLRVEHRKGQVTFHWRLVVRTGVIGFDVVAGTRQLNHALIPVHPSASYRYRTTYRGSGPYALKVVMRDGQRLSIPVGGM